MSVTLVLRALGIGDLVTGAPALELLRRARPGDELVLAAPDALRPLVARLPVDRQVHAHELEPPAGAPHAPDLAVDLHGNGPASRDLLAAVRPRRLLAYAGGPVRWRPDEHEVARWTRLVGEGLGVPAVARTVRGVLGPPPPCDVPRGRTLVHVGAKSAARRWPPSRFASVATALAAAGHRVAVTGGPGEEDVAACVAHAADVERLTGLGVAELMAVVGHAALVVSGDTGIAHLAAAYGTPSVTLFGPVSPARWGPPDDARHRVLWHGDGTGDPHGPHCDPALARITAAEVVAACALPRATAAVAR